MFKKLLKNLTNLFHKSKPDRKDVRELCESSADEHKSELGVKAKKTKRKKERKMAENNEVKKVDAEQGDAKTEEKVAEQTTEKETDKKADGTTDTKTETTDKTETTETDNQTAQNEQVEDTEEMGNGIPLEQVVTKQYLAERLAALDQKYEAILKENTDLKETLSKITAERDGLKDKYENKDFGNFQKKGPQEPDKQANETFTEYSKRFM